MFVPPNYDPARRKEIMKTIYVIPKFPKWWKANEGDEIFIKSKCPVDACRITENPKERVKADLVLFETFYNGTNAIPRPPKQLYAMYYLEPPWLTSMRSIKYPGKI